VNNQQTAHEAPGQSSGRSQRKWYRYPFLDPGLQFRFALIPTLAAVVNVGFFVLILYLYSKESLRFFLRWLPATAPVDEYIREQYGLWSQTVLFTVLLQAAAIFLFGLFFSHRLAGPIYAISRKLKEIKGGAIPRDVKLRRGSLVTDLAEHLNDALGSLRDRDRAMAESLEKAKAELEAGNPEAARKRLEEIARNLEA
jgi:hypothetical protein